MGVQGKQAEEWGFQCECCSVKIKNQTKPIIMKKIHVIISLAALVANLGLQTVLGKDAPATAEQLRSGVEAALRAKDTNAFLSLFNWQGVSTDTNSRVSKQFMSQMMSGVALQEMASVKLIPLPNNSRLTNELDGIRYRPNVEVVGMIVVEFAQKGNSMQMPYGKMGDAYYLSSTVEEKIPGPFTKAKLINIMVMGMVDIGKFTGSYVVVRNGKEINETIPNRGIGFYGDYLKSCTVKKTADNDDSIQLTIEEDGKKIFESEEHTNRTPIVYEKK